MRKFPHYQKMASGEYAINLEDGVDYYSFQSFAAKWAERLSLKVIKKVDVITDQLWECEKNGNLFWLAYDDWFPVINLAPQNKEAGEEILRIGKSLGIEIEEKITN